MKLLFRIRFLSILFVLLFYACDLTENTSNKNGSLQLEFRNKLSRSILPEISMVPTTYRILGIGPDNKEFEMEIGVDSVLVEKLSFGEWSLSIDAYNSLEVKIGLGSGNVVVHSNETSILDIDINPIVGVGNLDLSVNWNINLVDNPRVQAELLPFVGEKTDLGFDINEGAATYTESDLESGYYTLTIQLFDNGQLVAGTAEIVRIVTGQETVGSIDLCSIINATGSIEVNITLNLQNPLLVTMEVPQSIKSTNENIDLRSNISDYDNNVTYFWYVNGIFQISDVLFVFDDSWDLGFYNINLIAIAADGSRAGSVDSTIEVAPITMEMNNHPVSGINNLFFYEQNGFIYLVDSVKSKKMLKFEQKLDGELILLASLDIPLVEQDWAIQYFVKAENSFYLSCRVDNSYINGFYSIDSNDEISFIRANEEYSIYRPALYDYFITKNNFEIYNPINDSLIPGVLEQGANAVFTDKNHLFVNSYDYENRESQIQVYEADTDGSISILGWGITETNVVVVKIYRGIVYYSGGST